MTCTTVYCDCETPLIDVEHDDGCRRCGLPVDFNPEPLKPGERIVDGERMYSSAWLSRRPADGDRCGGRNTLTRFADVDRCTP